MLQVGLGNRLGTLKGTDWIMSVLQNTDPSEINLYQILIVYFWSIEKKREWARLQDAAACSSQSQSGQ